MCIDPSDQILKVLIDGKGTRLVDYLFSALKGDQDYGSAAAMRVPSSGTDGLKAISGSYFEGPLDLPEVGE
jgi:hypothetical protein